jgi:FkbM family methyltransferase
MLIPFPELLSSYCINPKGVLHLGASVGNELEAYYNNGVKRSVWVEALPAAFEQLKLNCAKYPSAIPVQACLHALNGLEVDFNISSNAGESSSYLEFGTHAEHHKDVTFINSIPLITKTLQAVCEEFDIDFTRYEFLNMDIQGCELLALQGMHPDHLNHIRYAYIEVNRDEVYKKCGRDWQIDNHLSHYGLFPIETRWAGDAGWGDRFYKRKD